uniref:Uncharacterized protein n=1 Tax=Panagrolaimus sp. PS1159 TaxID=55785 RepID=A0AC35F3P0_9BILA
MFLRSKTNPEFQIEVGPSVINCCSILQNVTEHTDNSDAVEVNMTQKQLEKFVELHNHFPPTATIMDKDKEWTNAFFNEMPENEFKELCWKADFLDSQRFLEAAGDFVLSLMDEKERKAMEEHPLEFFTGVSIQKDDAATPGVEDGETPAAADQPASQQ